MRHDYDRIFNSNKNAARSSFNRFIDHLYLKM